MNTYQKWVNRVTQIGENREVDFVYAKLQEEVGEAATYDLDELDDVLNCIGILFASCGEKIDFQRMLDKLDKRRFKYGDNL